MTIIICFVFIMNTKFLIKREKFAQQLWNEIVITVLNDINERFSPTTQTKQQDVVRFILYILNGQSRQQSQTMGAQTKWERLRETETCNCVRVTLHACFYQWLLDRWLCVDCSSVDFCCAGFIQGSNVAISFLHCFLLNFVIRGLEILHQLT